MTFSANNCGCSGNTNNLIQNKIHPLFLKAKDAAIKEDNSNWLKAMHGIFGNEYQEAADTEVETLEAMDV